MKAVVIVQMGSPAQVIDVETPAPAVGEVRVRVHAAAVNPFDGKNASGAYGQVKVPHIPGIDGAGVVEMVGEQTRAYSVGDRVFGRLGGPGRGTFAEYVVVPESGVLARVPEGLDFATAAALPVAGLTASGLLEDLALPAGSRLLVLGATGGVGSFLVQLAARAGIEVIATARPELAGRMLDFGAAATLDHTSSMSLVEQLERLGGSPLDALVDLVGDGRFIDALAQAVRPGGRAISTVGVIDPDKLAARQLTGSNFRGHSTVPMLQELGDLARSGRLVVPIERELSLEDGPRALEESRSGHLHGKTVLLIKRG